MILNITNGFGIICVVNMHLALLIFLNYTQKLMLSAVTVGVRTSYTNCFASFRWKENLLFLRIVCTIVLLYSRTIFSCAA